MKYKPGDTFEKNDHGIIYLMQVQEKGKAKRIKRITPYKDKSKANGLSNIPETKREINKTGKLPYTQKDKVCREFLLNTNKDIKTQPFNPLTHRMERIDNRTWKQVSINQ